MFSLLSSIYEVSAGLLENKINIDLVLTAMRICRVLSRESVDFLVLLHCCKVDLGGGTAQLKVAQGRHCCPFFSSLDKRPLNVGR